MTIYKRTSEIITTDLGHELILLDPQRGEMFALNEAGRHVWLGLDEPTEAVVATIVAHFGIEPARAHTDVEAVLSALAHAGLIQHVEGDGNVPSGQTTDLNGEMSDQE